MFAVPLLIWTSRGVYTLSRGNLEEVARGAEDSPPPGPTIARLIGYPA